MNKKLFSYFSAGILALSCYLPPLYLFTDTFMLPKFYLLLLSVGCMGIWVALAKGRGWGLPPLNDSLRKGGVSPDGHWVGLKLPAPQRIGKFRFIPRNDGNCVEIGDEYELSYWKNGDWQLLGAQVAKSNVLTFKGVPSGGQYILRDKTKGVEERIFTYEKGEQVWW